MNAKCVGTGAAEGLGELGPAVAEHWFILRPPLLSEQHTAAETRKRLLLICSTNTWTSYNNWGGANHYASCEKRGSSARDSFKLPMHELMKGCEILSPRRPYSPGFVSLPDGYFRLTYPAAEAPREPLFGNGRFQNRQQQRTTEVPHLNGQQKVSPWVRSSGWALYEKHFYAWAVGKAGYSVDICSNRDLHRFGSCLLNQYLVCVCAGHDEYWSSVMRDHMDAWLDCGGRCARFAGNFYWQVRFESDHHGGASTPELRTDFQVCHKYGAATTDPVIGTSQQRFLTYEWESPLIGRPGCLTFGLNGAWGLYARLFESNPSNPGGFTIYRPEHWALRDTGIKYGDMLAGSAEGAVIFGFECDGLDYTMRDGMPFPTGDDGADISATQIIGIGLCDNSDFPDDQRLNAACRYGNTPETMAGENLSVADLKRAERGNGMIVDFKHGKGRVFHVGSTEWIVGLQPRKLNKLYIDDDPASEAPTSAVVDMITRNVLDRFLNPSPLPEVKEVTGMAKL
eukprot:gnl/MRDRNA2_/MRDRNA2_75318_c0_seq1.p1 gnl/MRDRNA2_/MRDRNA2_75318_c0~~gnl/MRDRNA2_/MRDRNA2_75318_c0_seq1.p1  ORF type:complete len:566 (-),score=80.00 gnl/MRDRNA2_/MRDRNA2_75318_c0_seq1:92-1624(-)